MNELCGVPNRTEAPPEDAGQGDGILAFARRAGVEPDGVQERLLLTGSKRVIVNASRQWGKSVVAALRAGHLMASVRRSLVIVAGGRARRQGSELLLKTKSALEANGFAVRGDGANECSILLKNGSRMVALPPTQHGAIRGFSAVTMLIFDEAAFAADTLFAGLMPIVAVSGGSVWVVSTPYGQNGFFYNIWQKGGSEWERVMVKAEDCPRIPKAFLEEERKLKTDEQFRQDYCCEFVKGDRYLFSREEVERIFRDDEEAWQF